MNLPRVGKGIFAKLKKEVTVVQHCAWLVNFNQPFEYFDWNLFAAYIAYILKFVYYETDPMHTHFISSTRAIAGYRNPILSINIRARPVRYRAHGLRLIQAHCKHLLHYLTQQKNFLCTVEHIGHVCSDTRYGGWNSQE
ncbi:hypothetical protein BJV82DRAFT_688551 [Fennellomyces sp. T-0311]|nr:hypothetical protein BJV82DRAFT_688551 [Fennellomyces sp. T-0311]